MRTIARFMDARNTTEGKFLSVLLSVLLVFSFLNVTMFTDYANAEDEEGEAIEFVEPAAEPGDEVQPEDEAGELEKETESPTEGSENEGAPVEVQPESGDPEEEVSGTETETEGDGEQKDNLVAEQPITFAVPRISSEEELPAYKVGEKGGLDGQVDPSLLEGKTLEQLKKMFPDATVLPSAVIGSDGQVSDTGAACNKPRHWWYFTNDSVSVANQPTHNAKDPISGIPGGTTYLVHEICDNNDKVIGYEIIPLKVVESSADDQLSYNLNGAPGSIDPTAGKTGSEVIVTSEVPDWEGHEFLGWSTSEDSAFADYTAGDHYTLTAGDDILFAIWKAKTPQYTIEKSVANEGSGEGGTFKTGETINYKITVTNTGGVAYLDPIILGDSLVDLGGPGVTVESNLSGAADFSNATLQGLLVGETVTVSYSYTVKATDNDITNAVTANGEKKAEVTTEVEDAPALTAVKKLVNEGTGDSGTFKKGETAEFEITVTNTGNTTQTNVTVAEMPGAEIVAGTSYDIVDGKAVIASMAPGDEVTVKATYTVTQADVDKGGLKNVATVDGAGTDPEPEVEIPTKFSFEVSQPESLVYDGQPHYQEVNVTDKTTGATLTENVHYTLEYSENVTDAGEKTVTITGIGDYTGVIDRTYQI